MNAEEVAAEIAEAIKGQFGSFGNTVYHGLSDDLSDVMVSEGFSLRLVAERLLSCFDISRARS